MTTLQSVVAAWAAGATLCVPAAIAAGTAANAPATNVEATAPGSLPGDEALTCDQIYAQGMAETQREQQERSQQRGQMRAQRSTTAALMTGALMTGGLGGTGQAAQAAAEAQAGQQMAMLGAAPHSNARMEHLKQLWAQKRCVKK